MTALGSLWLPILVSAVLVFVASSIIHMAPLWHRSDYPRLAAQDAVQEALRPFALPPGDYIVPRAATMAEMSTPEWVERMSRGPVVVMTVLANRVPSMGRSLGLWFVFSLVVSLFAAYITSRALPPGADYLRVFQIAGATAFIGYALALWEMTIWYSRSAGLTLKATVDGLVYSLLTAGAFGWLWPQA